MNEEQGETVEPTEEEVEEREYPGWFLLEDGSAVRCAYVESVFPSGDAALLRTFSGNDYIAESMTVEEALKELGPGREAGGPPFVPPGPKPKVPKVR